MDLEKLKFPIGVYVGKANATNDDINKWINDIENFPDCLELLLKDASTEQLNYKYRPNGWMVKQVIHHCADSHLNSIIRFKLALTEELPTIKPYFEDKWAQLPDSLIDDVSGSVLILKGLHKKWVILLRNLNEEQLKREFYHPEHNKKFTLKETIGVYAWHCNHHLAHIENGLNSNGKYN
jgi:hypothetical protein